MRQQYSGDTYAIWSELRWSSSQADILDYTEGGVLLVWKSSLDEDQLLVRYRTLQGRRSHRLHTVSQGCQCSRAKVGTLLIGAQQGCPFLEICSVIEVHFGPLRRIASALIHKQHALSAWTTLESSFLYMNYNSALVRWSISSDWLHAVWSDCTKDVWIAELHKKVFELFKKISYKPNDFPSTGSTGFVQFNVHISSR